MRKKHTTGRAGRHPQGRLRRVQKQPTPYDAFMESEGIPVFRGSHPQGAGSALAPWSVRASRGHFIQLTGTETKWGCYVVGSPAVR